MSTTDTMNEIIRGQRSPQGRPSHVPPPAPPRPPNPHDVVNAEIRRRAGRPAEQGATSDDDRDPAADRRADD